MLKNPAIVFLIGLGVVLMAGCSLVTPSTQNSSSLSEQDLVEFVSVAELQGTIAFTYLLADAGNYVLQAGEEIVISWEDPPEGAQFYDLVFMNVGESIQWLGAFEIGDDGTLETTWIVPENQTGELIGIARFADESVVRSGCCSNIFSGTFPPEGICTLRIHNLAPQYLLEARDQASERIASVPPGIYLELLGRSSGGWYLVQTNQTLDGDQGDTSLYSGWLYVDSGVSLFGPCDGVPIHPDDEPQEPTVLSPGWIEVQDPVSGMRLAVPCFWIVDFPDEGQRAVSGAGTLRNYEYIQELLDPSLDLFEEGAIKIDLVFSNRWVPGDDPLGRLYAYQESMRNPDSDSRVLAVAEIEINGQIGLHVQVESIFGLSHYWLFELPDGSFMMFVPNRLAHDHPDVQAILGSIALSQDIQTGIPEELPTPPPFEMDSTCSEEMASANNLSTSMVDELAALQALEAFFEHLHHGEYEAAAELYGGPYEAMVDHNPSIDPDNHSALLQAACLHNGMVCLPVRSIDPIPDPGGQDNNLAFEVEFIQEDGSVFVLGPCCGADPMEELPRSSFIFTVRQDTEGRYTVVTSPIYQP